MKAHEHIFGETVVATQMEDKKPIMDVRCLVCDHVPTKGERRELAYQEIQRQTIEWFRWLAEQKRLHPRPRPIGCERV